MESLEKGSDVQNRLLKLKSIALQVKVAGNATPASKVRSSDLPGAIFIICQGQTSDAPSGVSYVAPDDATGKYSVIFDSADFGEISKVYRAAVENVTGTHTIAASLSNGYLVLDIDSSADLTSADSELKIFVDYLKA